MKKVSDKERYDALQEHIDCVGIEQTFQTMELPKGKELIIKGSDGNGMYAKGEGIIYVAIIPKEAFEN